DPLATDGGGTFSGGTARFSSSTSDSANASSPTGGRSSAAMNARRRTSASISSSRSASWRAIRSHSGSPSSRWETSTSNAASLRLSSNTRFSTTSTSTLMCSLISLTSHLISFQPLVVMPTDWQVAEEIPFAITHSSDEPNGVPAGTVNDVLCTTVPVCTPRVEKWWVRQYVTSSVSTCRIRTIG